MLQWDVDYEIGAVIVLFIILAFARERASLPTIQTRVFKRLIASLLLTVSFDVLTAVTISYAAVIPLWINYTLNVIYFIFVLLLPVNFLIYIIVVVHRSDLLNSKILRAYLCPAAILILATLSTPFTGLVVSFDKNFNYVTGPLWLVTFVSALFYFLLCLLYVIKGRKVLSRERMFAVFLFIICTVVLTILQLTVLNGYLLNYLASGILGALLYLSIENPDSYIDKETRLLNKEGFINTVTDFFEQRKKFRLYVLEIRNLTELGQIFGKRGEAEIRSQMIYEMKTGFLEKSMNLFLLDPEHFAVIMDQNTKTEQLRAGTHSFRKAIWNGREVDLRVYACVIDCPEYASSIEEIINLERYVLEQEKATGQEFMIAEAKIIEALQREMQVRLAVHRVVEQNEIQVFYQPICDAKTGKVVAAEALARLYDKEIGWIPPMEFISISEQDASIMELGRQIFRNVCEFISQNDMEALGLNYVSVNFSPVQCMQLDLGAEIIAMTNEYKIKPSHLTIELTESVQVQSPENTKRMMERLQLQGIRFSLDDYGTGYSNITYITGMNFNIIKLDRSILLTYFEGDSDLLKHTITMFKDLGFTLVAEGVETKEQAKVLEELGCDYLQGFYFSRPVPGDVFVAYVNEVRERR